MKSACVSLGAGPAGLVLAHLLAFGVMRVHLEGVANFYDQLSGGEILDQLIEWR